MGGGWGSGDKLCRRATCPGIANWKLIEMRHWWPRHPFYRTQLVQVQRPDILLTSLLHAERDRPWRAPSGDGPEHPQFFPRVEIGGSLLTFADITHTPLPHPHALFISP